MGYDPNERSRVGEIVGSKYRLERLLGAGAMGAVYRATRLADQSPVAVKILFPEHVGDREVVGRFLQEARAAGIVSHPNVVQVSEIGQDSQGSPYIVQELLQGGDLAQLLEEARGRLTEDAVLQLLIPAAEALGAAHAKGVFHRDVKPANVYLARIDGKLVPKVLDFGISRITTDQPSRRLTATGIAMGTPLYMAPEQVREGARAADARSDVWSLGVILYEAMAGEPPFQADNLPALFVKISTSDPAPLASLAPQVTADLVRVVAKCLQRNQADRYGNAGLLARDLKKVRAGESIDTTGEAKRSPSTIDRLLAEVKLDTQPRLPKAMPVDPPAPSGAIGSRFVVPSAAENSGDVPPPSQPPLVDYKPRYLKKNDDSGDDHK